MKIIKIKNKNKQKQKMEEKIPTRISIIIRIEKTLLSKAIKEEKSVEDKRISDLHKHR